jgi:hypothetical protein
MQPAHGHHHCTAHQSGNDSSETRDGNSKLRRHRDENPRTNTHLRRYRAELMSRLS